MLAAQSGAPPTLAGWRADLQVLAPDFPRHPAPFLNITRMQWDSAVASLNRRLPALNQDQTLVAFFQLVALPGDAHTTIQPNPARPLHFYPIEFYSYEDGLFVGGPTRPMPPSWAPALCASETPPPTRR